MTGIIPEGYAAVRFAFLGSRLWNGGDYYPDPVGVPRVPVKGEHVVLPDDLGVWEVMDVIYDYSAGLYSGEPIVGVVCARPSAAHAAEAQFYL